MAIELNTHDQMSTTGSRKKERVPWQEWQPVSRIRIHMFLGLPDPDPFVRGIDPVPVPDPDPSVIMQK
jgi:hypothetical protein